MEHERKRRRLEKSKAVEQEIDVAYLPQKDEVVSRIAPMSLLSAAITKKVPSTRPMDACSSNSLAPTSRISSTTTALVAIKQEPLTQIMAPQENAALDAPIPTSGPLQPPAEIPLPGLVLEYASKLTPIDQIKWPPAKPGRFHIFGLIMSIGLEEQIVSKAGQGSTKRLLSVCDQSATSFKLDLWRERCRWGDLVRPGDVVLITDVQTKEYRQKVTGNTSTWSRMSRLDGSVLASYRGHPTLETFLRVFIDKRRVLALDLLDSGKGIVRAPSYYLSLGDGVDAFRAAILEQERQDPQQRTDSLWVSLLYTLVKIDATSKEPYPLSEDGWNATMKNIEARRFDSIRSLRQHKFMGNAILDAYILAVSFPDLVSSEADQIEYDMLGFIQCYCTGCQSAAVSSPQNPSILFCPFCHLDPQRNHHPLEWMYPGFELSLGDKPRLAANLSSEALQLRCQYEIGDQVFVSVPARKWTQSEEGFQKSRMRWKRLVQLMNSACGQLDRDEEGDTGRKDSLDVDLRYRIPQKVRVEVRVGVNMMTKALKVDYL
ncbi:hypothetical protein BGX34_001988 [Mortierella sp. NVP85]|nr:hypothetical protein BGX34_001988 [Mortierella sp. NVP85]